MNQSIIFNNDLRFDKNIKVWRMTGLLSGQLVQVYFHSEELAQLSEIDNCTQYDLEEVTELWLEKHEPEDGKIHIHMK